MKQHSFTVIAIFPLKHELEMLRDDGRTFYWKLHQLHKIQRYSVGQVVTPFIPNQQQETK